MNRLSSAPLARRHLHYGIFLLLAGLAAALLHPYLHLDFWNDELYTLQQFVLKPAAFIATDYHVPNNHVFFNLLSHFYLQVLGISGLGALLEQPWLMRLLPAAFVLGVLWLLFRIGFRAERRQLGLLAGFLLATTHAYQAFALQIRGYGLGALLLTGLIYCALSFFRKGRFRYLPGITTTAALALYTLPSNLYFLLGAMLGCGIAAARHGWQIWRKGEVSSGLFLRQRPLAALTALMLGTGIGLLLYAPVFGQVFFNPYVTYEAFRWQAWSDYPPRFAEAMTGGRWLLLLPLPMAFWGRSAFRTAERWVLWCTLLLPFFLAFVLGNPAPIRIFVVAFPLALLLWADGLHAAWMSRALPAWPGWGVAALVVAYCGWAAMEERRAAAEHLAVGREGDGQPLPRPRQAEARRRLHLTDTTLVLATAARLVPWKGVGMLIELVSRLSQAGTPTTLLVIGDGPERHRLETAARAAGVSAQVQFLGAQPRETTLATLSAADLFLLNTAYEGLSHFLLEVMCLGIPIITTPVGGNPELITDGLTGRLVPVNDLAAWQAAVTDLAARTEQQALFTENATKRVADFTLPTMLHELGHLLQSVSISR